MKACYYVLTAFDLIFSLSLFENVFERVLRCMGENL